MFTRKPSPKDRNYRCIDCKIDALKTWNERILRDGEWVTRQHYECRQCFRLQYQDTPATA